MQCFQHPEKTAAAFCTNCGKAICSECIMTIESRVVCVTCAPELKVQASTEAATVGHESDRPLPGADLKIQIPVEPPAMNQKGYPYCSPGVCFALGLIPGVGAICNGEHLKAFLQVLVFGTLVSLAGSREAGQFDWMLGILSAALYFYMPLEAYHVSKRRTLALRGILVMTPFERIHFSEIWAGVLAIGLGTLFLVNQYVPATIPFILRGWPLLLIAVGAYNLMRYFRSNTPV